MLVPIVGVLDHLFTDSRPQKLAALLESLLEILEVPSFIVVPGTTVPGVKKSPTVDTCLLYIPTDRLTSWDVLHYPCTVPVYKLLFIRQ
jgi:hypothetical protein